MDYSKTPLSAQTLAKIRYIQLHTKKLLRGTASGDFITPRRGYGLEFDQLRDYEQGDDVRFIDWKSSARSGKLMVKQHLHEHTHTVLLALDISGSTFFGSGAELVQDRLEEAALVLLIAAMYARAAVGLLLFDDEVVNYFPPRKGQGAQHALIEEIMMPRKRAKKTNIAAALRRIIQLRRRDAMVFLLTDGIDTNFHKELSVVSRWYDVIMVRILDRVEHQLPSLGMIYVQDPETGQPTLIDTRDTVINNLLKTRLAEQQQIMNQYGIDALDIQDDQPLIDQVVHFFAQRMVYRR
jgi:uncharacterized protein (DUF58 family)